MEGTAPLPGQRLEGSQVQKVTLSPESEAKVSLVLGRWAPLG